MCSRPPAGPRRGAATALACLALAALALSGCGHKEPPKPPPQIIPARTADLRVAQRGEELLLTFTYPTTTIAGAALGDLEAVEYWQMVREMRLFQPPAAPATAAATAADDESTPAPSAPEADAAEDPETAVEGAPEAAASRPAVRKESFVTIDPGEFVATAKLRLALKAPDLEAAVSGSTITVRFPLDPPPSAPAAEPEAAAETAPEADEDSAEGAAEESAEEAAEAPPPLGPLERVYAFAVKTVPARGLTSFYSNIVAIVQREAPAPPREFECKPGARGITLTWEDEPEAAGFRVYRRDARARSYGEPIRVLPAGFSQYVDRTAEFGRRYIYTLTAMSVTDPVVESAITVEHEIDYEDRFPPLPPTNPIAFSETGAVRLIWDASEDVDVAGYVVERAEADGGFEAVNDDPVTDLELTDRDVVSGRDYRYRIYAVDDKGNQGRPSEEIEVRVP